MNVLELFGGIGACTAALKRLGIDFKVVDYVEIDKYAVASYNAINNTNFEPQDITQWDKDLQVDLIMHGSPCQDFSVAGKQAGGDQGTGTRSSLMYETVRIVKKLRPKYVIWENVKNVLSKTHKHNFDNYINQMEQLGYTSYYKVLNAKDFNIPQNRERVFVISVLENQDFKFPSNDEEKCEVINPLKDISGKSWQFEQNVYSENSILRSLKAGGGSGNIPKVIEQFDFPQAEELELKLKDILEDEVDEKYYLSSKYAQQLLYQISEKYDIAEREVVDGTINDSKIKDIANCITARYDSGIQTHKTIGNAVIEPKPIQVGSLKGTGIPWDNMYEQNCRVYSVEGLSPTLDTMQGGHRQPKILINNGTKQGYIEATEGDSVNLAYPNSKTRRGRVGKQVAQTLQTSDNMGVLVPPLRIRKLTPKECWRLMGFSDEDFEKAQKVNSNTQLYKQAGNSIVVNVLVKIFTNLFKNNQGALTIDEYIKEEDLLYDRS